MPDLSAAQTRAPAPADRPWPRETLVDFLAALRRQFFADEPEPAAVPAVEPAAGPLPAGPDPGATGA